MPLRQFHFHKIYCCLNRKKNIILFNPLTFFMQVWKKRWVMVRRPYVFLFRDERDYCERGIINLAQAKTEYSAEQQNLVRNTFSITTKQNVFLIQTMNEKDVHDWLYAINPLLAGKIR